MGIKMALPQRDVVCFVGDGSYMMANSELATAVMMAIPFTVVLTDNRGYGCINRLQKGTGGAPFNNMLDDSYHVNAANIDFVAHARSMGANVVKAAGIGELEAAMQAAKSATIPTVIVIDTDAGPGTGAGGTWWDVAVPEVSTRREVNEARKGYEAGTKAQWLVN
jgi:3D-(3,5/4)-trihydroxycyclohexane-1,2-dione acylhydrolase (decyclizing)